MGGFNGPKKEIPIDMPPLRKAILSGLVLLMLSAACAQAQPVIQPPPGYSYSVVNAFSFLPNIAPGSWFVIFGTGLGPSSISVYGGALPFPATLSGTSVTLTPTSGGPSITALMYYTLASQVAAMLPSSTAPGYYDVQVTYNGQISGPQLVQVVPRNFGFATQRTNGQGPAQATYGGYNLNRFTTGTYSGPWTMRPANPGDVMVLWGTGLGADSASDLNGGTSGDQTVAAQVSVIVSGISVTPAYSGRSPGAPGLDQINFTVPSNVSPSCFVSLQVSVGGSLSNLGSIAVAPAGQSACTSSGLAEALLHTLDLGGTVTAGGLQLGKSSSIYTPKVGESTDTAAGWFGVYHIDEVANSNLAVVQPGACYLVQRKGTADQLGFGQPPAQTLNAGTQLTLNGPNASNTAIPLQSDGAYLDTLYSTGLQGVGATGSPTLAAGTYTVTGTGGADVGAFSAQVTLPGDFSWTNETTVPNPVVRSSGLTVTWTGNEGGLVVVLGSALTKTSGSGIGATYSALAVLCTEQASAGSYTIPANILQQLPAVSGSATASSFGYLSVFAIPNLSAGQGGFTAPLTAGGTVNGVLGYEVAFNEVIGFE